MTLPPIFRRGDIHLVHFKGSTSEADGARPAIIATNNTANISCPSILVIPTTTEIGRIYNFQLLLESHISGLNFDSKVQVELLTCVGSWRIKKRIGYVPQEFMTEIDQLVIEHLGLSKYYD